MKIQVKQDSSGNGEVFVWGLWGHKTIEYILRRMSEDIEAINRDLRSILA